MQLNLLPIESNWRPPDINSLPDWKGIKRIAVDLETKDPNIKTTGPSVRTGGYICGYGFAFDKGPKFYLPTRHEMGGNMDRDAVERYMRHQLKHYDGEIVGANLSYDLDYLWHNDMKSPNVKAYKDVQIAEACIDENKFRYNLDSLAKEYLGDQKEKALMMEAASMYGMKKKSELGAWINILHSKYVGLYGEQDCALPLKILALQEEEIKRQNIERVWQLETEVLPVLVKMRQRGVRVDEDRLFEVEIRCNNERREAAEFISKETGVTVGPDDASQKTLLTKAMQAAGHKITETDPLDKYWIANHEDKCEVAKALGRLRKWDTLRKLSIEPVKQHLVNGRIHCTFNQMASDDGEDGVKGARYGRLSAEHVNMQQQPSRDEEIGPIWRRIYLPEEGMIWGSNDYSQQEPRMLIHWAEIVATETNIFDSRTIKAVIEAANRYRNDPSTDNHQMMADMAGIKRKAAKAIFLGLVYSMGGVKLCRELGLPVVLDTYRKGNRKGQKLLVPGPEGKKLFSLFHKKVPFVSAMESLAMERANKNGYVTTLSGRRCRFPRTKDGLNFMGTYRALNRLIQGSSADQTKRSLVEADKAGYFLQLQVHDEITGSFADRKEAEAMAQIMIECEPLRVPSKVDVETGPSWGEAA